MMTALKIATHSLHALLDGIIDLAFVDDVSIGGLSLDSRSTCTGDCFLALAGNRRHGREFIDTAVARGACVVLLEDGHGPIAFHRTGVPVIAVPELRRKVGLIAARYYGQPSRSMTVVGVTGTNGKTSVSHLIAQALNAAGVRAPCGVLGTIGYGLQTQLEPAAATTPDPVAVQAWLARFRDSGARGAAIEVSSHALDQHRVAGVHFAAAVFTNLTRDHLDYHQDMEQYGLAKQRLFEAQDLGSAVVNLDDPYAQTIIGAVHRSVPVYGYSLQADRIDISPRVNVIAGRVLQLTRDGLVIAVRVGQGEGVIRSRLLGRFNAANLMAACATLLALGVPLPQAVDALQKTQGVPGRMERFGGDGRQPLVIVDYAHTPDGLEQALLASRELCPGRLICVFGCGGNRDTGKRPLMGEVAKRYADSVIVTSDNPRDEDPAAIIGEIVAGMGPAAAVTVEADRRAAIALAVSRASRDDVILVAGKGHEAYQEIAGRRLSFSDRAIVLEALREVEA